MLPRWIKFMPSNDEFYPAEFDSVIYDCYNLRVVFDREKTKQLHERKKVFIAI